MNHLKRQMIVNAVVLNVLSIIQCPEHPQSGSNAPSVINEPTTLAPDLATFVFVEIASLMIIMRISCLNNDVFVT
jgi:hypothetical protein